MTRLFQGKWLIWLLALASTMVAAFGVFRVLADSTQTVPVYAFAQDVAANTMVTDDLLTTVDLPVGAVPANAVTLAQLQQGQMTAVAVGVNQPVTSSVLKQNERIPASIPSGYVVTSIEISPADAVGGQIKAGDLVDIAAVADGGESAVSKVVMHRVLIVDVASAPRTIQDTTGVGEGLVGGPNSYAAKSGYPLIYTVAVTPEDFAKLAVLRNSSLYFALSADEATGEELNAGAELFDLFGADAVAPSVPDSFSLEEQEALDGEQEALDGAAE